MKIVTEKHICDVCGCEVTTEQRITVDLNVFDNWSDDAKMISQIKKDVCQECYDAWLALFNLGGVKSKIEGITETTAVEENNVKKRKKRNAYDKDELLKLWAMGLTYQQIANKLNISRGTVNNVLWQTPDEDKAKAKEKYGVHRKHVKEEPEVRVVTDECGIVQSIERV